MITTEQILLYQQLEEEAREMRRLQCLYFKTRDKGVMADSISSERKVDSILAKLEATRRNAQ